MGREYSKRAVGTACGLAVPVNSVTLSDVAVTLAVGGVNAVTYNASGNSSDMVLPPPITGDVVRVIMNNGTSSLEANINTEATGSFFFGTAFNTITALSTANDSAAVELIAVSTAAWGIVSLSVNGTTAATHMDWALSATTGSTSQS